MSVFSVTALDRLIEAAGPSSSSKIPMERNRLSSGERKPPYSFYPPLYATPAQQRPPSPSSFSPSPYIVNFKRRGSLKSADVVDKASQQQNGFHIPQMDSRGGDRSEIEDKLPEAGIALSELKMEKFTKNDNDKKTLKRSLRNEFGSVQPGTRSMEEILAEAPHQAPDGEVFEMDMMGSDRVLKQDSFIHFEQVDTDDTNEVPMTGQKNLCKPLAGIGQVMDRCQSASSQGSQTSGEEFFDAPDVPPDDSSSEDEAMQIVSSRSWAQRSHNESDGRRMGKLRLEILRRIRAEEALLMLQSQWDEMSRKFSALGLFLPPRPCEGNGVNKDQGQADFYDQLFERLVVARLVGGAVARGAAKAEKEEELDALLASKNSEITRLRDKLQYFELVNHEMSQRNQESIERAQRHRRRRQKKQQWAFGCIGAVLCVGTTAALAYKFFPLEQARLWRMGFCSYVSQANEHGTSPFSCEEAA